MSICHLLTKHSVWVFDVTNRTNSFYSFQSYHEVVMHLFNLLAKSCTRFWKYSLPYSGWTFSGLLTNGGGGGAKKPPLLKICHTHPTMMKLKLYLTQRTSKKDMNHVAHPLSSDGISIFSPEISKFCYIQKYRYRLHFDT